MKGRTGVIVTNLFHVLFQAKLQGYRHDKLKRKCPVVSPAQQEELEVKKRMLTLMERSDTQNMAIAQQNQAHLTTMTSNIAQLTASITHVFGVLCQMIQQHTQPPYYTPHPHITDHTQGHLHNKTQCHLHNKTPHHKSLLSTPTSGICTLTTMSSKHCFSKACVVTSTPH